MFFRIEYEHPPLRGIYKAEFDALDEGNAVDVFRKAKPNTVIRKINGVLFDDPNRPMRRPVNS